MLVRKDSVLKMMGGGAGVDDNSIALPTGASSNEARSAQFEEVLGEIQLEHLYCMPCSARWSMHQLLEWLVAQTGPAEVWLMSWTITEAPMRALLKLVDEKRVVLRRCVFDDRVRKYNANAAQLAFANIADVRVTGVHAKCMVVRGSEISFTVCSTANLTRNKNVELYWISTHVEVATFHAGWIDQVHARSKPML